jgi:hypothetical protein
MLDYLEDEVDEKYYITGKKADDLIKNLVDFGIERERDNQLIDTRNNYN